MIKFRQKEFGKVRKAWNYVKKYPTLPLSASTLGISTANFMANNKRYKNDKEFREHQNKMMDQLTNSLNHASESMNRVASSMDNFDSKITPVIDRQNKVIASRAKKDNGNKRRSIFNFW